MKNTFTVLTAVLMSAFVFFPQQSNAQVPNKISYQAVIRDANNLLATNWNIGMQISVLQGSASGQDVFVERHFPTTNANGLASIEIGTGVLVSGNFATIDWSDGTYFIKSETDLNGGANYTIIGTSQILSVPYALHAKYADSISNFSPQSNAILDTDGDTKVQVEKNPDEDIIRFDMAGIEYFNMANGRVNVLNTGHSVFLGEGAGANNSLSDCRNTAIGYQALYNSGGFQNTALGYMSLHNTETGYYNTATGYGAMLGNTEGDLNTANGFKALYNNTIGDNNTAIGNNALYENVSGDYNVAIGYKALNFNTTGNANTAIGFLSDVGADTLSNATAIGAGAKVNQSNCMVLGNNNINVGIGTSSPEESAILELNSSSKGFLPPRMTVTQRDAIINPSDGLIIFNTTSKQINVCVAGAWYVINMEAT